MRSADTRQVVSTRSGQLVSFNLTTLYSFKLTNLVDRHKKNRCNLMLWTLITDGPWNDSYNIVTLTTHQE